MDNPFEAIKLQLERIENRLMKMESLKKVETKNDPFIDVNEAAKVLNVRRSSVYQMVFARKIPYYKAGKRLHFKRDELLKLIESGRRSND